MYHLTMFVLAAVCEIAGCFAFWMWLKRGAAAWVAAIGVLSLIAFAVLLARAEMPFAGRAYRRLRRRLHCGLARVAVVH
jgi:small multidrug resistance family-3 protein